MFKTLKFQFVINIKLLVRYFVLFFIILSPQNMVFYAYMLM